MTPNQLESLSDGLLSLYGEAELRMLKKMAKRGYDISDGNWYGRKTTEIKAFLREMRQELKALEKASKQERDSLLKQAYLSGQDGFREDYSKLGERVPESRLNATAGIIAEMDKTFDAVNSEILRDTDDVYKDIVGNVVALQSTGISSTQESTKEALEKFAERGICGFVDKAGRRWNIDSYARMAVRTGMMRAAVKGYTDDALAHDEHLVIVSDHQDTCPICSEWERKVLALDSEGAKHPDCEGTLADAEAAGLFHPNCLHAVTVYVPGLTIKEGGKASQGYTPEMDSEGYENRQKQRYMERNVRKWKRLQAVADTPENERYAQAHVRQWQRRLIEFTDETGLPRQYYREGGRVKLTDAAKKLKKFIVSRRNTV